MSVKATRSSSWSVDLMKSTVESSLYVTPSRLDLYQPKFWTTYRFQVQHQHDVVCHVRFDRDTVDSQRIRPSASGSCWVIQPTRWRSWNCWHSRTRPSRRWSLDGCWRRRQRRVSSSISYSALKHPSFYPWRYPDFFDKKIVFFVEARLLTICLLFVNICLILVSISGKSSTRPCRFI